MRTINAKGEIEVVENTTSLESETLQATFEVSPLAHKSYHELADRPLIEVDALTQLHSNLLQLGDLQERLAFVMREVRYLMKV